jgi:FeS assembly SUF system protein
MSESPKATVDLTDDELETNIIEMIKTVYDPEIPVNVYDLGLIYGIRINPDRTVQITMTLTAPNCPAAGFLPGQVEQRARTVEGVTEAEVELTFEPPYNPEMMSEEAKLELGFL